MTSTALSPAQPTRAGSTTFADLGVPTDLLAILDAAGITVPTPIQAATLPDSLAGRDVLGRGRTGSGKTYAFAIPVIARLAAKGGRATAKRPRALILAPTRELATQIEETVAPLARAAGLSTRSIFGGVGQQPQVDALRRGIDVLIACPGRLEDLIGQGHCNLSAVDITVLDEADHMADLGFLPAVRRLLDATPRDGQRMLFSATLDNAIDVLVRRYLTKPRVHEADSAQSPVIAMDHHVLHVTRELRIPVLADLASAPGRTIIFTRTKHGAKTLARKLNGLGIPSVDLHGNLSQNARTRNMTAFHEGTASTLVATDIAARGIHVDDVALVVHADPPTEHKAYLHRSGRTARAGAAGTVITLAAEDQRHDVRSLTRAAGIKPKNTTVADTDHPVLTELAPGARSRPGGWSAPGGDATGQSQNGQGRSGGGRSRGGRSRGASGAARSGAARSGAARSGAGRSGSGQGGGRRGGRSGGGRSSGGAAQGQSRSGQR
ncbi:DEAD/DEAH box helicase [Bogoriella caseilytica]|uniref:Superfamily II DNA/RNA helicase n=1 Tax=Bogoriella caseilytica TaxID=56055 RepID=A0A3N2BCQ8_9MICO|nr:DEAD/DEAH box helicase [Bogoriella caseilytica]ROR73041.1 superfamily II DNA/RNA helicase [Bogoriella caseilytica]